MSGHSKWSTIKRQKGANDAKRGLLFSKLARAITIAAKQGGIDPAANFKLRLAMDKGREANMPKENIDRAIEKAKGGAGGELFEVAYEGYGPGGVAIMVEAATDNKNRTAQEIKNIFERGDGALGSPGSVSYQFEPKGVLLVDKGSVADETTLALMEIEGIEDVEEVEDGIEVNVRPGAVFQVKERIEALGMNVKSAEVAMQPKTPLTLEADKERRALRLIESLDDHEDVQKVYANLN